MKIIGNQVIFSPFNVGFATSEPTNLDSITLVESIFVDIWDGYPKERTRLLNKVSNNPQIDNIVVLTGDFHCSFAFDVPKQPVVYPNPLALNLPTPSTSYDPATGAGSLFVEFATPSITSANFDENLTFEEAIGLQLAINSDLPVGPPLGTVNYNPHLKYVDFINHGYMLLDLTEEAAQADWYYVNILDPADDSESYGSGQLTMDGTRHLTPAAGEAAGKLIQPPLAPVTITENGVRSGIAGVSNESFTTLNVYPIPVKAGNPLFLHYALNTELDFSIELMDISGRIVSSETEAGQAAGTYTFTLPTAEDLPAGVYFLRMGTSNDSITRKIIVE